ncbi:hypothetical protein BD779DRAFT_1482873 [Infundibulicybe gibba]|nr:hypothetical protein BD779DRAFT_1482873 [Infundibulicybe gibba]
MYQIFAKYRNWKSYAEIKYGNQVWKLEIICRNQVQKLETICGNQVQKLEYRNWKSYVEIKYRNWKSYVEIKYRNWKSYVEIKYRNWKSYVEIKYRNWKSYVEIKYRNWKSYVEIKYRNWKSYVEIKYRNWKSYAEIKYRPWIESHLSAATRNKGFTGRLLVVFVVDKAEALAFAGNHNRNFWVISALLADALDMEVHGLQFDLIQYGLVPLRRRGGWGRKEKLSYLQLNKQWKMMMTRQYYLIVNELFVQVSKFMKILPCPVLRRVGSHSISVYLAEQSIFELSLRLAFHSFKGSGTGVGIGVHVKDLEGGGAGVRTAFASKASTSFRSCKTSLINMSVSEKKGRVPQLRGSLLHAGCTHGGRHSESQKGDSGHSALTGDDMSCQRGALWSQEGH